MTQQSKFTPGPLRACGRNYDTADWVIRDANNHIVAGELPKEFALLFAKAPEMYELLELLDDFGTKTQRPNTVYIDGVVVKARRIKAEIDGE